MEIGWYCTGMLSKRQQSCLGVLWFSKRPIVSLLEKQRNWHHDVWFLIINIQANRVAIESSVITKIFFPCKYWTVTDKPFVWHSVNQYLFCSFQFICSPVVNLFFFCSIRLFDYSVFYYSVYFSVLILKLYSRYFDPYITTTIQQSINIILQTAPSLC